MFVNMLFRFCLFSLLVIFLSGLSGADESASEDDRSLFMAILKDEDPKPYEKVMNNVWEASVCLRRASYKPEEWAQYEKWLKYFGMTSKDAPYIAKVVKMPNEGEGMVLKVVWFQKVSSPIEAGDAMMLKQWGIRPAAALFDVSGLPSSWDHSGLVNKKDGSVLVTIPSGKFFFGRPDFDQEGKDSFEPLGGIVSLPGFQISKYEVTNAQFAKFLMESNTRYDFLANREWYKYAMKTGPRYPAMDINLADAKKYCQWAGLRLPTDTEWERAARGTDARIYPWGNQWNPSFCLHQGDLPRPVGSMPNDVSPEGCWDMAGGVPEWTSSKSYPDLSSSDFYNVYGWLGWKFLEKEVSEPSPSETTSQSNTPLMQGILHGKNVPQTNRVDSNEHRYPKDFNNGFRCCRTLKREPR